jgi:hypothetical protein
MSVSADSTLSAFIRRRPPSSTVPHQSPPFPSTTSRVRGRSGNSMISPRSSSYERLEGGLGASRLGMRNIAWRKIVLCLTITVGVLWFLRPSKESSWSIKTPGEPLLRLHVIGVKDTNELIFLQCGNHPRKSTPIIIACHRVPWPSLMSPKWWTSHPPHYLIRPMFTDPPHTSQIQTRAKPSFAPRHTIRPYRSYNMR